MNVLLDTNVVLDVLFRREPYYADAAAIWRACDEERVIGHVSAVTLTTVYYVGRRYVGHDGAKEGVAKCLAAFRICATYRETLVAALRMPGSDFEDNVQIATAATDFLQAIVTRDRTGYADSPIPVLSPSDLLARLPQP